MDSVTTRKRILMLLGAAAIAVLASAATLAVAKGSSNQETKPAAAQGAIGAQAPRARLAALVNAGGDLIRSKGVKDVQVIDIGNYCIKPKASAGIAVKRAVVMVAIEHSFTEVAQPHVEWADKFHSCGKRIGVYTFADPEHDGSYNATNEVAFSIVVP